MKETINVLFLSYRIKITIPEKENMPENSFKNMIPPEYLIPVVPLVNPVELVGDITEKVDAKGNQRTCKWVPGLPGWVAPIEVIRGRRKKRLPGGKDAEVLDVQRLNVTVWSSSRPVGHVGDYVKLRFPHVGAIDSGSFYLQCFGIISNLDTDETGDM